MPLLCLKSVGRSFGEECPVIALRDVSLSVADGDYLAIEGASGSGKSTLLNQLALIDRPTHGLYEIDGRDASTLSERDRARLRSSTFGFVFQNFHLMASRSAIDNVELGLLYRALPSGTRRKLAHEALIAVGLSHREGLAARKLSGGECQRVAIARAMVGQVPVIVADEPTGNLDSTNGDAVVGSLGALHSQGRTVILVTHDSHIAAQASRRVRLRDGTVFSDQEARSPSASQPERQVAACMGAGGQNVPGRSSRLRFADLLRESWKALAGRPGRSAILVGAVATAVALVVVTLGLSQTASAQVSAKFDILRDRDVTITVPTVPNGSYQTSAVPLDAEHRLSQIRGLVAAGVLELHEAVSISTPGIDGRSRTQAVGMSPGLLSAALAEVTWVPGHRRSIGHHEVLLGAFAASELQLGPLALAPSVVVDGVSFEVAGIIRSSGRVPSLTNDIAFDRGEADRVSHLDESTVYITTVGGAAPQVAQQAPLALDPAQPESMQIQAPPDPETLRGAIENDVRAALLALSIVAALGSIIGVANAMLLSVIERIGELGLRRAIGARPLHILGQTACEALMAGCLGGLLGLLVGEVVVLGFTIGNRWTPVLDPRLIPLAIAGGVAVGVLGGLPASVRASRIQPADALRR